jgi:hypothetical protein
MRLLQLGWQQQQLLAFALPNTNYCAPLFSTAIEGRRFFCKTVEHACVHLPKYHHAVTKEGGCFRFLFIFLLVTSTMGQTPLFQ